MGLIPFLKYLFNDVPLDYQGPEHGWHVVPNFSRFTYSSVAGDFRLYPIGTGFVASWQDFLSARNLAGQQLWRLDNTGYAVAVSAQGQELISFSHHSEELVRVQATTGQVLERFRLPDAARYTQQLLWLPDNRLLVLTSEAVGVLSADRQRWEQYFTEFAPMPEYGVSLLGMAWWPERPQELLVADNSGCRAFRLDLTTGQVLQQLELAWPNFYPGPHGRQALVYTQNEYLRLDPATLAITQRYPFEGLEGVRTEAENQHQNSCTLWEKRALLSPGGKYLLAVDQSGLVWLYDAKTGYQLRIFRRELLDHAYDLLWLDDKHLVALLNRGHVAKVDVTQLTAAFNVTDFTPADDARHLPNVDEYSGDSATREASTPEQLRQALDTIATTPDAARYAEAWEVIHYAPFEFAWDSVVTSAHIAGALRRYTWFMPAAGFAGLASFAELRRQLLAVQYFLPEAPVAPVLALHDDVLERHTYATVVTSETFETPMEAQLSIAYQNLHDWLLWNEPATEDGQPFLETEAYTHFAEALQAVDSFLQDIQGPYLYEAHNLLEQAICQPQHLAQYEAFVISQSPAAQVQLLDVVTFHDDPKAIDLLRRLRTGSPHPTVRAFVADALSKAGDNA